jgi:hypothetical protein
LYLPNNKQTKKALSIWNQVIDESPMKFIKHIQMLKENGRNRYYSFVVLNTCEISEEEFNEFIGHF